MKKLYVGENKLICTISNEYYSLVEDNKTSVDVFKENDILKLDIDPKSHYAWTGGTQKILDKGRVSKYNEKFSKLRSKK